MFEEVVTYSRSTIGGAEEGLEREFGPPPIDDGRPSGVLALFRRQRRLEEDK